MPGANVNTQVLASPEEPLGWRMPPVKANARGHSPAASRRNALDVMQAMQHSLEGLLGKLTRRLSGDWEMKRESTPADITVEGLGLLTNPRPVR
jgi:hypothetical protein